MIKSLAISLTLLVAMLFSLNTAQAANEKRVLIFGDSLMELVSRSMRREINRTPNMEAESVVSIGSGLARMDLFNWNERIQGAVDEFKPNIAVVMIGANDNQPMMTDNGAVALGTSEWAQEYRRRVAHMVEILTDGGVEKIYWIGMPDMRTANLQRETTLINEIVKERAGADRAVEYIDTIKMFSVEPGNFSPYIIDRNTAMPIHVRNPDGVHLNRTGADMLSKHVLELIDR